MDINLIEGVVWMKNTSLFYFILFKIDGVFYS